MTRRIMAASSISGFRFDRHSLRWRLVWFFAATAILTVSAFGVLAYRAARTAAVEATQAKLHTSLQQIQALGQVAVTAQIEALRGISTNPAVIDALRHPERAPSAAAVEALKRAQGSSPQTAVVDLLAPDGRVIYTLPTSSARPAHLAPFDFPETPRFSPFVGDASIEYFTCGVAIRAGGATVGGVRMIRPYTRSTASTKRAAEAILGPEGVLMFGNAGGAMWADDRVPEFPTGANLPHTYVRNGETFLTESIGIPGSPWAYAVAVPLRVALQPARSLVLPFAVTGALIAIAAVLAALALSRSLTAPLAALSANAEALTHGQRQLPWAGVDRKDEIGRLARSFQTMAASMNAVRDKLEADIDMRTGELTSAVARLQQLDQELKQSERFAALGRLSGSVGHELRNPLGVMNTVVFMLDALPDASPKIKDYASKLREQIRLSERIISDLLDRARSDAPVYSPVEVPKLVDDLIAHAEIPPNVAVERQFDSPMPEVVIDRDHFGQILWNLVRNAVQAMQDAGGTLRIGGAVHDGRLTIAVEDSGPGVPPEHRERVFEPMFTTKADGVGLGLAISRAFARANGGDLSVESAKPRGARFVLQLPAEGRG